MTEETDAAFRYRQHAEELRAIAADSRDPYTKKTLLGIAADYEAMAKAWTLLTDEYDPKARALAAGCQDFGA